MQKVVGTGMVCLMCTGNGVRTFTVCVSKQLSCVAVSRADNNVTGVCLGFGNVDQGVAVLPSSSC